ncbi:flagellar biosynthetic protein FliR [Photobacterium lutimaris]|uniref:Flagellar biosynthetic protein FliR n=1 Tax=Photobacterium lutimaris TaxID=388278 RepID=A0A2T3IV38_9GAMM|nr:flagellar biosynthetic protein FliR [Photobacterium lutimaris]PSU32277.1 flagellar biosynthetic protein FliR [Photobacterium lutimaris]TDR73151.1 flagellar biosynthetic protein FliR [Photobacterium lutimaris]
MSLADSLVNLTFAEITAMAGQLWWPFFRISAAFMTMPFLGNAHINNRTRLLLALSITLVSAPLLPPMPAVDPVSVNAVVLAGEQIIIGALLGMCLQFLFAAMAMVGQIMSMQMGLGMAMMNDPANGVTVALLGNYFLMFTTLLFLALDGHLVAVDIVVQSFGRYPVGGGFDAVSFARLIDLFSWMMTAAVTIALPTIAAMLTVNLTFGVMNRAAPSLNVFALGFPMSMMLGLCAVLLSTSGLPGIYAELCHQILAEMHLMGGY